MTNRTDNFNRTNGAIGTPSDGGSAWIDPGDFEVFSNQARETSPGGICPLESSIADADVQVTMAVVGADSTAYAGLVVRYQDSANYIAAAFSNTYGFVLVKWVAGSPAHIGASPVAGSLASGDVLKVTLNGSSITFYANGVSKITATESTFSTATKHGLYTFGSLNTDVRWEDFSITALSSGGSAALSGSAATPGSGTQSPVFSIGL